MGEVIAAFAAILADTTTALKVSGAGAVRLSLDVDESELPEMVKLIAYGKERLLKVTVETE
jgi:hypothetical protein